MIEHDSVGRTFVIEDDVLKVVTPVTPKKMVITLEGLKTETKPRLRKVFVKGRTVQEVQQFISEARQSFDGLVNICISVRDSGNTEIYYVIDVFSDQWSLSDGYKRIFSKKLLTKFFHLNAPFEPFI